MAIKITVKKEPDKNRIEVYREFYGEDGEKKLDEMIGKAIVKEERTEAEHERST